MYYIVYSFLGCVVPVIYYVFEPVNVFLKIEILMVFAIGWHINIIVSAHNVNSKSASVICDTF